MAAILSANRLRSLIPAIALSLWISTAPGQTTQPEIDAPTLITMHYKDAPLADVLEDFARQAGDDMGIHARAVQEFAKSKRVTVDMDRASFWQAVQTIGVANKLKPLMQGRRLTLGLVGESDLDLSMDKLVVCGPFAVIPRRCAMDWTRTMNYGKRIPAQSSLEDAGNMTIQVVVVAEPKLRVISINGANWLKECVDDKKNILNCQSLSNASTLLQRLEQWNWQLQGRFSMVPGMGGKIASMKGQINCELEIKTEVLEIDDVLKATKVSRSAGDNRISLESLTQLEGSPQYQAKVTLLGTGPNKTTVWMARQRRVPTIHLFDETGAELLQTLAIASGQHSAEGTQATLTFTRPNGVGEPKKLTWEVTVESKQLAIPFEITDLEIPSIAH